MIEFLSTYKDLFIIVGAFVGTVLTSGLLLIALQAFLVKSFNTVMAANQKILVQKLAKETASFKKNQVGMYHRFQSKLDQVRKDLKKDIEKSNGKT